MDMAERQVRAIHSQPSLADVLLAPGPPSTADTEGAPGAEPTATEPVAVGAATATAATAVVPPGPGGALAAGVSADETTTHKAHPRMGFRARAKLTASPSRPPEPPTVRTLPGRSPALPHPARALPHPAGGPHPAGSSHPAGRPAGRRRQPDPVTGAWSSDAGRGSEWSAEPDRSGAFRSSAVLTECRGGIRADR